jgi:hypothetical protein
MALPFLEGFAATSATASAAQAIAAPATRVAFFYVPIGVIRSAFFPVAGKPGSKPLELTPTLAPLANVKDKVNLITNLDRTFQQGTDVHAQCASCFMSSAAPYTLEESAWPLDRTLDQLIADQTAPRTPFRSLELSCNSHKDNLESMYFDNISWYGTGHVAPSIRDPRTVYRRLFGTANLKTNRDITDLVLDDARSMKRELGYADTQKFDEYFEAVRTIETQMDKLERMKADMPPVMITEPGEASEDHLPRGQYIRLMGDLMVLALQTNLTHVASLMVAPERWNTPYLYDGVFEKPVSHHGMSHNQGKHAEDIKKIDLFNMRQFAYILEKMDAIQEANGSTLLDNTVITYGSGLADGSTHLYDRLPIITAGSAGGRIKTGRHLEANTGTPLANLWLSYAKMMGAGGDRFADSTGELKGLMG